MVTRMGFKNRYLAFVKQISRCLLFLLIFQGFPSFLILKMSNKKAIENIRFDTKQDQNKIKIRSK